VLNGISHADMLRAVADYHDGVGPEGFREPSGWVIRLASRDSAHRPVIARAAVRTFGRDLTPQDFGGNDDKRAKWWLEQQGFDTPEI
jgi:hypothetical protein